MAKKTFLEKALPVAGTLLGGALPVAGAVTSFIPEIFKFFKGRQQIRQANAINPIQPNFQMNTAMIDNARILGERSNNYTTPGYNLALDNINQNASSQFNNGVQGASSGGDVLDLANKINYGTNNSLNQLAGQNAQGADNALQQYLQANSMAGNELVRKNQYDLDQYQRKLNEKAALLQAGNQNSFSAGDNVADGLRYFTQPQKQVVDPNNKGDVKIIPVFGKE